MALSILIPVYNYNVTSLVQALAEQLTKTGKEGEIILLDDGSSPSFISANETLDNLPHISFYRNEKNEGRTAARIKLSTLARYNYLLFLDGDSSIIKDDFIGAYFNLIEKNIPLATGGRIYSATTPACEQMLHWKYGKKRERQESAPAFMSNNFLIRKEIFTNLATHFQLPGYGHEDTWWGIQFEQAGISCTIIHNPVLHADLSTAPVYLSKAENAVSNLLLLEKEVGVKVLSKHVKIFRWHRKLKRWGLAGLYVFFEKPFHSFLRKNLLSCHPNLFYFDCYRLAVLIRKAKNNQL